MALCRSGRSQLGAFAHAPVPKSNSQVLSSPSEAGLDLVNDEQDAVVVANLPQALEVTLGRGDVTSLAENGLDDEGGGVAGSGLLLEEELELRECSMR